MAEGDDLQLEALARFCSGTPTRVSEGGRNYILLPGLRIPSNGTSPRSCDGLLEPEHANTTYPTRLYLREKFTPITKPGLNWHDQVFVNAETFYTWSWKDVSRNQPLSAILLGHLAAFE
jgi:hypothetical protein